MVSITPPLLAAAYAKITIPNAPRTAPLTVIGIAAADIPPSTVADTVFDSDTGAGASTLASTINGATASASSAVRSANPGSFFSSGHNTASKVLGTILDIHV